MKILLIGPGPRSARIVSRGRKLGFIVVVHYASQRNLSNGSEAIIERYQYDTRHRYKVLLP